MIPKSSPLTKVFFVQFVRDWFKSIARGDWQAAFDALDLPPDDGMPYTPERFRQEIENDHFAEGTVFRKQHPAGIVYSDPDVIGESKYTELYPLRSGADDPEALPDFNQELDRRLQKG